MTVDQIKDNVVATIAYKLTVDGEVIDEADSDDPIEYLHGHEDLLPGLERELAGKHIGDSITVTLAPDDGYGEYDPEDIEAVALDDFPPEIIAEMAAGMDLVLEDDAGNEIEAMIKEVNADEVVLDFNSPLAGKTLTYEVAVLDIRAADEEEIAHGHVHSQHDHD